MYKLNKELQKSKLEEDIAALTQQEAWASWNSMQVWAMWNDTFRDTRGESQKTLSWTRNSNISKQGKMVRNEKESQKISFNFIRWKWCSPVIAKFILPQFESFLFTVEDSVEPEQSQGGNDEVIVVKEDELAVPQPNEFVEESNPLFCIGLPALQDRV